MSGVFNYPTMVSKNSDSLRFCFPHLMYCWRKAGGRDGVGEGGAGEGDRGRDGGEGGGAGEGVREIVDGGARYRRGQGGESES